MHPGLSALLLAFLLAPHPAAAEPELSVQEVLLRAKPAVALVVSTVESEVTLACPDRTRKVAPPPTSEMGSGWLVRPDGWLVTNAHVILAAHRLPESVRRRHLERAARPG